MANSATPARILSVDDDPDVSNLLRLILQQEGYQVSSFLDGHEALAELAAGKLDPDLILLDLDMPTIDGYAICERLQAEPAWSLIPVVFLTASGGQANRLKAFQLGAVGFLNKPVDPVTLGEQIAKFLEVRQKWKASFEVGPTGPAGSKGELQPTYQSAPLAPLEEAGPLSSDGSAGAGTSATLEDAPAGAQTSPGGALVPVGNAQEQRSKAQATFGSGFAGFKAFLAEQSGCSLPDQLRPEQLYDEAANQGLDAERVARLLASWCECDYLDALEADALKLGVLPAPFCRRYHVVPISDGEKTAFVLSNPFYMELDDMLARYGRSRRFVAEPIRVEVLLRGRSLQPETASEAGNRLADLAGEVKAHYQPEGDEIELDESGDENAAPLIRLVNRLIENAYHQHASDIHIEPREKDVVVRYRVDGELRIVSRLQPANLILPIAARLKVMSGLNIAERRLPQDGRISFREYGSRQIDLDLRVATAPMHHGEKIVMRLIDKSKSTLPLEALGFSARNLEQYRIQLQNPYGMVLHVGPTGSGKSMTLYAALNEISRPQINIQTAEDPIEYTLPDINQLQVKPEIGLTFARALRAYLRQDPDVILVGEIRDRETAHIALEAALTGHLLLSTLHTNDAASTLLRFVEMGMEPYLVSASVLMICAQRLLRRLCVHCRRPGEATPSQKQMLGWPEGRELQIFWPEGCQHCEGSGYSGRLGVHELLIPGDIMRQALSREGISAEDLKKLAVAEGMTTLFWDGIDKVMQGLTSFEEVSARVRADEFPSAPAWWREMAGA